MTTYYVDATNGSDSNNGLGPDASHASNKPFQTVGKIIATSGVGAAGDIVYFAPGSYRQVNTVNITSPASELQLLGDPLNTKGFKTSGGVLVAPGHVIWTAYLTNDKTAPSATNLLNLNGRDNLTFQDIVFVPGSSIPILATTTTSQGITFRRCSIKHGSSVNVSAFSITTVADTALNWTFDSCIIAGGNPAGLILVTAPAGSSAEYDVNVQIQNCMFYGLGATAVRLTGAASNKPGGVDIFNSVFWGCNTAFQVATGGSTVTAPCTIYNCNIIVGGTAITATATGEILEDFNIILAGTARTNTSTGGSSTSNGSYANLIDMGEAQLHGFASRPFFSPMSGGPALGFGAQAGGPSVDLLNRPRPAGGASTSYAVGAYERHQTAVQETSVTQAGSSSIKIVGPGDHDFNIPVDASSTVLSIYVRYDTNHGTGNKPQVVLLANAAIGVSTETKTATVGVDTWEQLTFSTFTPTAKGFVTIRCTSRAAAGGASSTAGFDYFRAGEPLGTLVAGSTGGIKTNPGMSGGMPG